jgi:hypothetical protein
MMPTIPARLALAAAAVAALVAFGAWSYWRAETLGKALALRTAELEQTRSALSLLQAAAREAEEVLNDRNAKLAELRRRGAGTVRRVLYCPDGAESLRTPAAGGVDGDTGSGLSAAPGPAARDIGPGLYAIVDDADRLAVNYGALVAYIRAVDKVCRQ